MTTPRITTRTDRRSAERCRRQRRDNIDQLLAALQTALRDDDTDWAEGPQQWGTMGHLAGVEEGLASALQQLGVLNDDDTPELMQHYGM